MKQEILTLEQGLLADALVSLRESHKKISRFMQKHHPLLDGDRYLTDKEVAGLLKVSRRTLQKMRNDRTLPFLIIGGKALYREHDIQMLLERNYRKAEEGRMERRQKKAGGQSSVLGLPVCLCLLCLVCPPFSRNIPCQSAGIRCCFSVCRLTIFSFSATRGRSGRRTCSAGMTPQ